MWFMKMKTEKTQISHIYYSLLAIRSIIGEYKGKVELATDSSFYASSSLKNITG